MRWTEEQKLAKAIRDRFGDVEPFSDSGFIRYAGRVGDFLRENPPPTVVAGEEYLVRYEGDYGESEFAVAIGPDRTPDLEPDRWVFRLERGSLGIFAFVSVSLDQVEPIVDLEEGDA